LARKPRGWTGARTPSALKRVRTAERRAEVNQPRRSAAKTLVSKAVRVATGGQAGDAVEALKDALSALDRAAKAGAIHANAAARRKSRLTRKVNAALGGAQVQTAAKLTKTTGKAAAVKAAKARIAAGKAEKAKGAQTAAGKAKAAIALSRQLPSASNLYRPGMGLPVYNGLPGRVLLTTERRAVQAHKLGGGEDQSRRSPFPTPGFSAR